MLKPAGGGSMTFLPIALGIFALHVIAVIALVVTGHWSYGPPPLLVTINPLYGYLDGAHRVLVPRSLFDSFSNATALVSSLNLLVWAALQWLGAGFILDMLLPKK